MSAADASTAAFAAGFEAFARLRAADDPAWLGALRREALGSFSAAGLPTTRLEEWRYTNIAPIAREPFVLAEPGRDVALGVLDSLALTGSAPGAVFVDGWHRPDLSVVAHEATAVESLARVRREEPDRLRGVLGSLAEVKDRAFAALNTAYLDDGAFVSIERDRRATAPLLVSFATTGATRAVTHPRVLVRADAGSEACVVLDFVSLGEGEHFTNAATEIAVGRGASVALVILQRESSQAFHVGSVDARLDRDARLAVHTVTLDGRLVRNDANVVLAGEGAEATMNGLYLGAGEQLIDNHTRVDHATPHGTSRELYKGVLGGRSRGVFRGRVVVRPGAQKTDATQSNPNLLTSDAAEVDSKPQLEIYADDVKCAHGSTIGQLDPDALFYLRARGIDADSAAEILGEGFAAEVLEALPVPDLRDALHDIVRARIRTQAETAVRHRARGEVR